MALPMPREPPVTTATGRSFVLVSVTGEG
jgi:hypothetical protein